MIIGGGVNTANLLDVLHHHSFFQVKAVIDDDSNAPGITKANAKQIRTDKQWEDYLNSDIDIVFEMSGDDKLLSALSQAISAPMILLNSSVVNLFSKLLEENKSSTEQLEMELFKQTKNLNHAEKLIHELGHHYTFSDIYGQSEEIELSREFGKLAAENNMPILLRGEMGTGKELFAHAIHNWSSRSTYPFIHLNCRIVEPSLLEQQLFGEAIDNDQDFKRNKSMFTAADKGTLYLDEVAYLPVAIQKKLVTYIQEGTIYIEGSDEPLTPKVKLIMSTSDNLEKAMSEESFSEDLYYLLNRISIQLPPLRLIKEDILTIVYRILVKLNEEFGLAIQEVSSEASQWLSDYKWPGNIRELESVLNRALIYIDNKAECLSLADLEKSISISSDVPKVKVSIEENKTLADTLDDYERKVLEATVHENGDNKAVIAERLGISLRSLYYKLEKFGLL